MNQIFKDYLDWHRYVSDGRTIVLPRSSVSRIIDKVTDQELSEIAGAIAKKNFIDVAHLRGEVTLSFYLDTIENWLRISALPYKHEIKDNVHNFIIAHRMGKNFSFYLKEFTRNILHLLEIKSDFTITDNIVAFKFSMSD